MGRPLKDSFGTELYARYSARYRAKTTGFTQNVWKVRRGGKTVFLVRDNMFDPTQKNAKLLAEYKG